MPDQHLATNFTAERSEGELPADTEGQETLFDDLLVGAEAIAAYLYGNQRHRRKIYHLAQTRRLPVFKLGSKLCARRSTLLAWIEGQETNSTSGPSSATD